MTAPSNNAPNNNAQTNLSLIINAQYLKDFSFENPQAPAIFSQLQNPPGVDIQVRVNTRQVGDLSYEVVLSLRVEGKVAQPGQAPAPNAQTAFLVEIAYGGIFTVPQDLPADYLRPVLTVEAPRILFPFARSIIASAVAEGGFGPLLLNPIDFAELYRRQLEVEAQNAQTNAQAAGNA